jgi:DNA repair protein RadA
MPKKDENDSCSLIERLSSSQMARRLADYCREKGLDVRVIATLTPAEVAELVEGDAEQAESLLRKLNDALAVETVKGGSLKQFLQQKKAAKVLKTRVAEFDEKTPWGGVRFGAIYGFAGEYGTGKSLMAMQIAAYAAAEGHKVAYLYTEGQFSEPIFLRIAARAARELNVPEEALLENVEVYEIANSFALQQLLIRLPSAVNVVVVDSIIEPFRAEYRGREQLQRRQQDLHYVINLLKRRCIAFGTLAVVTNQVMDVPEVFMMGVKKMAGGNILAHTVDYIFVMHRPNKKKLEGVMYPHDVPGMSPDVEIRYTIEDDGLH